MVPQGACRRVMLIEGFSRHGDLPYTVHGLGSLGEYGVISLASVNGVSDCRHERKLGLGCVETAVLHDNRHVRFDKHRIRNSSRDFSAVGAEKPVEADVMSAH